jgi:anti-sigma factor RsiW
LDEEALEGGGFSMTHATPQEWQEYVAGTLAIPRYEELDMHLYDCEHCLQQYILAIDSIELTDDTLPALSIEAASDFADRTLIAIQEASIAVTRSYETPIEASMTEQTRALKPQRMRTTLIRRPLFQYAVAAAATLLLLSTGVFQSIEKITTRGHPSDITLTQQEKLDESFSQQVLERTTSLLDNIHTKRTGGTAHE